MATIKAGIYKWNDKLTTPTFDLSVEYELPFVVEPDFEIDFQQGTIVKSGFVNCVSISFDFEDDEEDAINQFLVYNKEDGNYSEVYFFDEKIDSIVTRWDYVALYMGAWGLTNASELNGWGQIISVTEDTEVDDTFATWFNENAVAYTETAKATITYNGEVIATIEKGQTATLPCNGKRMTGDIVITL